MSNLKALGNKVTEYAGLDVFPVPAFTSLVRLASDEVTALCPVTGQPDQYSVFVSYAPDLRCVESKTFKLLLQSVRNTGVFCEDLADRILIEVKKYAAPKWIKVSVVQKPRGGVAIVAESFYTKTPESPVEPS